MKSCYSSQSITDMATSRLSNVGRLCWWSFSARQKTRSERFKVSHMGIRAIRHIYHQRFGIWLRKLVSMLLRLPSRRVQG